MPGRRRAFSLVEMLVVFGILAVFLALILPAVQKVREAANRMYCAGNIRQLGIAAHHYDSDHGSLPPGYLGPSPANNTNYPEYFYEGQWIGHCPLLLPYLEQDSVYKQIDLNFSITVVSPQKWFWSAPAAGPGPPHVANYRTAMKRLQLFRCPSAAVYTPTFNDPFPAGGGTVLGIHVFNSPEFGATTGIWKDEYGSAAPFRPLGSTNYHGVAGCGSGTHPFFSRFEGICTNRSRSTLGQVAVRDGTSNTLLYGESAGSIWEASRRESMDVCWMASGGLGTYHGLQPGRNALVIAFSSYHAAGVQFCFADGSVRLIRYGNTGNNNPLNPDWLTLQQLAGWRDGATADTSALVD
jgi:type II secretory pathway pseudopilin PulG